jgi:hypothetical protein
MSKYHVRIAGSVYGPFTTEQLQQMAASGRLNGQAELSQDRQSWMPAATLLGTAFSHASQAARSTPSSEPTQGARVAIPSKSAAGYLASLRNRTHYPFYRTTVLFCSILGYILACLPVLALLFKVVWTGMSSIAVYEPFAALFAAILIGVFVTVIREIASMYADLVDSTLDTHSKNA